MAKKMTDQQRQILRTAMDGIAKEIDWFYGEVVALRGKGDFTDDKSIKKTFRQIQKTVDDRLICHASDVVERVLGWIKGPDTVNRNRYLKLTNSIAIANGYGHDTVHQMFLDACKYFLLEDYDHPMDAFLSRKEQRSARQRRRTEKKYGPREQAKKASKPDDEKKKASRLRRLRRKAKEEGITMEEYKTKYGYNDEGLKAEEASPAVSSSGSNNNKPEPKRKASGGKRKRKTKSNNDEASDDAA